MKTFSEILDTKKYISCVMDIKSITENGCPNLEIVINDKKIIEFEVIEDIKLQTTVPLLDAFKLKFKMSNKVYHQDKETAIIINCSIDGNEILPRFQYLLNYNNDKKQDVKTNYMGFNGELLLDINKPFYEWYHQHTNQGVLLYPIC
tara:strand:+ start:1382 stop:1822 length:441 start_codon:yes stop_codon:yes gene_type:complete